MPAREDAKTSNDLQPTRTKRRQQTPLDDKIMAREPHQRPHFWETFGNPTASNGALGTLSWERRGGPNRANLARTVGISRRGLSRKTTNDWLVLARWPGRSSPSRTRTYNPA